MQKFAGGCVGQFQRKTGGWKYALVLALAGLAAATGWAQPANDLFANAIQVSGNSGTKAGNNIGATSEPCEPVSITTDDFAYVDKSVWYSWTAVYSGPAEFDTLNSDFDTVLCVYTTPTTLCDPGLTLVAANDDAAHATFANPFASQVYFTAVAGTTYYISVNGNQYPSTVDSGSFVLDWNATNSGVNAVATIPSGTFLLTTNIYTVSENESSGPRSPSVFGTDGARITVTRSGGDNGVVTVGYVVAPLTYTNVFTTNTVITNFWEVSQITNGVVSVQTNIVVVNYTDKYGYYEGGYKTYDVTGTTNTEVDSAYKYQITPSVTNLLVLRNLSGTGPYPAKPPPFNLTPNSINAGFTNVVTDGATVTNINAGVTNVVIVGATYTNTFITNTFQLPSVLLESVGVNFANTFDTNTYGVNTLVTMFSSTGIYSTISSATTMAFTNYFTIGNLAVTGVVTNYSVISSNIVFLQPTAVVVQPVYETLTSVTTLSNVSGAEAAYPADAPPLNLGTDPIITGVTNEVTDNQSFTNTFITNNFQLVTGQGTDPAGDTFTTNTYGTNTLVAYQNPYAILSTNYIFTIVAYANSNAASSTLTNWATTNYTVISSNLFFTYFTNFYYANITKTPITVSEIVPSASLADFTPTTGAVTFYNLQMSADIFVPVSADAQGPDGPTVPGLPRLISVVITNAVLDPLESVALEPPSISVQTSNALLSVLSDNFVTGDTAPPVNSILNFERANFEVDKDFVDINYGSNAVINVLRSGGSINQSVSVNYTIDPTPPIAPFKPYNTFPLSAGSDYATPNVDYTPVSGTLTWGANDTAPKQISIPIFNPGTVEPNVDLWLQLYNNNPPPAYSDVGEVNVAHVTILFEDLVTISSTTVTDGQQPAGAVDRSWNIDNDISVLPPGDDNPGLQYPGTDSGSVGQVYAVAEETNGEAVIAGSFITYNGDTYSRIVETLPDGEPDAAFLAYPNTGANSYITALAVQPDGRIVIGGNFTSFNGASRYHIARLNPDGTVDTNFNPGLGVRGSGAIVWSLSLEPNGQIIIGGNFTSYNTNNILNVARLNPDGSLDTSFNPGSMDGTVNAVAVDAAGRVLMGGNFNSVWNVNSGGIARLNVDGSLDTTFMPGVGTYNKSTGVADPVDAVVVQPNGQILIGGSFSAYQLLTYNGILRLNPDGSIDTTFQPGTGTYNPVTGIADTVQAITLQPDGNILIGGNFQTFNQTRRIGIARLFNYGSVDTSFMDTAYNEFAGIPNYYYNENAVNPALIPSGNTRNSVDSIALEAAGNVIIGGIFNLVGGGFTRDDIHYRSNVARLIGGATPGPGNIEFSYSSYSATKTAGSKFITLVRTNGSLGAASVTFSTNTAAAGAGVATPNDFSLSPVYADPTWPTVYSLDPPIVSTIFPGLYGPNNDMFYTAGNTTTYFGSGQAAVFLSIFDNTNSSGNLSANLALSAPFGTVNLGGQNILLGAALGTQVGAPLTIIDTGGASGTFSFASAQFEVAANATNAVISVLRSGGSEGTVYVSYSTANGTAGSTNYTSVTGTLTFPGGVTSNNFLVPIKNINQYFPDKTVNLSLYNVSAGGKLGLSAATLTIVNSFYNAGQVNFTQTGYGTNANARVAYFSVSRVGGSTGELMVTNSVTAGTAVNGRNFTASTNVLVWNTGDVSLRTIAVPIFDPGVVSSNLTINLALYGAGVVTSGGVNKLNPDALGLYTNATITLTNVDFYGAIQFSTNAYSVDNDGGYALIPVERYGGSDQTVTVNYATIPGTAQAGTNYVSTSGTLAFTNGQVSQFIKVPILNDGLGDGLLALTLALSTNAGPVSILGNPSTATLYIIDATDNISEPAGSPDTTFSSSGCNSNVYAVAVQANNQILVGGDFTLADGVTREHLARLNDDGSLDSEFLLPYTISGANSTVRAIAVRGDGRIIVGGNFTKFNNYAMNYLAVVNSDGTLSSSFNPGSGPDSPVYAVAETIVGGQSEVLAAGAFETIDGGTADGGATLGGIARLNGDGTLDTTFNPGSGANATVYALAVQSDGKVLIGGDFTAVNGATNFNHIGRLNTDGSVDTSFNAGGGGANDSVRAITVQPDGRILIGGIFTNVNGVALNYIARLNADGSVDPSFQPGLGANGAVLSIGIQLDGRIVLGGSFTACSGVTRNRITRLNPDGTVDPTINFGLGANDYIAAVAIQEGTISGYPTNVPDAKIIIGGQFTEYDSQPFNHLARIYGGSVSGSGSFQFSSANYQVNENATNIVITIERLGGTSGTNADNSGDIFVPFYTGDGSAVAGINYTAITNNLDFPEGEVVETVTIPVFDDGVVTTNLIANLYLGTPFTAGDVENIPTAQLTIINDDSTISFSSATYLVPKNILSGVAAINIIRSGATYGTSTALFSTTTGTATPITDYTPVTQEPVIFAPGVSNITVTVPINNNNLPEGDRTIGLQLSGITGSFPISPTNAVLTIHDTVTAPGQFAFSASNYNVTEGGGSGYTTVMITVVRTNGSLGSISVPFATQDGTALGGLKYIATNGVLNFTGNSSQSFPVEIVNTTTAEGPEYFNVVLSNPSAGSLTSPSNATVTILNTNTGIAFGSPTYAFTEPTNLINNGTLYLSVVRFNNTTGVTTVNYSTTNGTAVAGINFVGVTNGLLTFQPGVSVTNIPIGTIYDPLVTGDLTFTVGLFNPSGAQLTSPATATITDHDANTGLSFLMSQVSVFKNAGYEIIFVQSSNTNVQPVSVAYATGGGTAVAGADYTATSGILTFTNNQQYNYFVVPISPNNEVQSNKTFLVTLSNPQPTGLAVLVSPSVITNTIINTNTPYGLSFSTPLVISGEWSSTTVDNTQGAPEVGDPVIAGNPPTAPVWFQWTAPADGEVTVDTINSVSTSYSISSYSFTPTGLIITNTIGTNNLKLDTVLGVFTGNSLGSLNQVAVNDDMYPQPFPQTEPIYGQLNYAAQNIFNTNAYLNSLSSTNLLQFASVPPFIAYEDYYYQPFSGPSELRFNAKAGVTYYIAADTKPSSLQISSYPIEQEQVIENPRGLISLNLAYHPAGVFRFATENVDLTGLSGTNGNPLLLYQCAETESAEDNELYGTYLEVDYQTTHGTYYRHDPQGLLVTVTRVAGSTGRVSVDYTTVDGNPSTITNGDLPALAGTDYTPISGTLIFNDYEMSKTLLIPITDLTPNAEPNRDFTVVLSNPQRDPLESSEVSPPRVDSIFGTALCRILDCNLDPKGPSITQVITTTTNFFGGITNVLTFTNQTISLIPTNAVFNFSKANYRVVRDQNTYFARRNNNTNVPVTVFVNRFGTNQSSVTLHWRLDNFFLNKGTVDDGNIYFPLQPGSDYANPPSNDGVAINENQADFAGVGGQSGTITFPAKSNPQDQVQSQEVQFNIDNNQITEFNRDVQISLYDTDSKGNPIQDGMVAQATVTILFNDGAPPAGSVDEFYNPDVGGDLQLATNNPAQDSLVNYPGTESDSEVYSLVVLPTNTVATGNQTLIAGSFATYTDGDGQSVHTVNGLARLNSDGSLDTNFNASGGNGGVNVGASQYIQVVQLTATNRILIGGDFTAYDGAQRNSAYLARLTYDGLLDPTFTTGSGPNGPVWAIAQQADGRIIIGGAFTAYNGSTLANHVARINPDGSLDTTFNAGTNFNSDIYALSVEGDDNAIVVGGAFTAAGGRNGPSYLVRLNSDGSLDTTFDTITGPNAAVRTVTIQPDDRVLAGGDFTLVAGQTDNHIARFNPDGSLDSGFTTGIGANDDVYSINYNTTYTNEVVVATNTVITLTNTVFTTNTVVVTNYIPLPATNVIYIGGSFTAYNGTHRLGFARLYTDGTLDTTFLDTAYNQFAGLPRIFYNSDIDPPGTVYASGVQDDGNIMIAGAFQAVGGGQADAKVRNNWELGLGLALTPSFEDPNLAVDEDSQGEPIVEPKTRDGVRYRGNVARLIGGVTSGPGNLGLASSSYAANKAGGSTSVSLVRTNGSLGYASANFSVIPGLAKSGSDYSYAAVAPIYPIGWEYLEDGESRDHYDGLYGSALQMNDKFGNLWNFGVNGPASVNINLIDDTATAGDLSAHLQLANPIGADQFYLGGQNIPVGVALGVSSAPLTLLDTSHQDGVFGFAASSFTANHSPFNVGIVRTNGTGAAVTVYYQTVTNGSTAIPGTDYIATNGSVIFGANAISNSFPIIIKNTSSISSVEKTVGLQLYKISGGNATLGLTNALLRLINPSYQGFLNLSANYYSTNLSGGAIAFTVTRTVGSLGTLTVQYATTNGTALNGVNYVGATNTLTWNSGDVTPRTVFIPLINSNLIGSALQFGVAIANPTLNGTNWPSLLGATTNAILNINNNNSYGSFQFSASQYRVNENGGAATLTVTRTGSALGTVAVAYATSDGTATAGANYSSVSNVLTFAPGQISGSFKIKILPQDTNTLSPSAFYFNVALNLLNNTNGGASLGTPATATVNIVANAAYYQPPGSPDPAFDPDVDFNGTVLGLAFQSNGQIVAAGQFTSVNGANLNHVARLNTDGSLDTSFLIGQSGADGEVNAVVSQTDDRILIGGAFAHVDGSALNNVARLMTDGTVDTSFAPVPGADNSIYALAEAFINGSRVLYVGGALSTFNGIFTPGLVRLDNSGNVDTSFATGLGAGGTVYALAVYPTNAVSDSGDILVGGSFTNFNGLVVGNLVRLNPDGSVDTNFNGDNALAGGTVRAITLQLDGEILIGGDFTNVDGVPVNHLARLNPDGTLDRAFVTNLVTGINGTVDAIALQQDNSIMVGGQFSQANGVNRNNFTRVLPSGAVDPTVNFGDGANGAVDALLIQPADGFIILGGAFTELEDQPLQYIARLYGGSVVGSGQFTFSSANYRVDETNGFATITVLRTGGSSGTNADGSGDVLVTFTTANGTALAGTNYLTVSNTLDFALGQVFTTVNVPILDNGLVYPDVIVNLDLSNPTPPAGLGNQATAQLTILNDISAVSFSSANYSVPNDTPLGVANIMIVRVGSTSGGCSVYFSTTTNGTAVSNQDYYPTNATVVFGPGVASQLVQVPIINNTNALVPRTVALILTNAFGTALTSPTNATLTINDSAKAPGELFFATNSYTVLKASGNVFLTVLRTNGSSGAVSVNYATVAGTASPGLNYLDSSGSVSLGDGVTSAQIAIPLVDNTKVQGTVNFSVNLSDPQGGATLVPPTNAVVNILDHNFGVSFLNATNYTVENSGAVTVVVQRIGAVSEPFSVNYATIPGTAQPGTNYTPESGTLNFASGESLIAITVPILYNTNQNGDLFFNVELSDPTSGAALVAPTNSLVVIHDSNAGLSFTNAATSVLENAGSVTLFVVCANPSIEPVVLSTNITPLEVNYYTTNGSAIAGQDYTPQSGTLVFTNGIGTNTITVPITGNTAIGNNRTFSVVLANPTAPGQLVPPSTETVTIVNVNSGVEFSSPNYTVLKTGIAATINVNRIGYTNSTVEVNFSTTNGTALAGQNFVSTNGTLTFTNGITSQSFSVPVIDSTLLQPDLTLYLQLSGAVNAALTYPSFATLTIVDLSGSFVVPAGAVLLNQTPAGVYPGIIYPGQTNTLAFAFRASAGTNVNNLVATLLVTNGVTAPSGPQSYGPLTVGGHAVSRPFTFTASGTNGQQIAATFALQNINTNIFPATTNNLGTNNFTFYLGTWTGSFSNTAPIIINSEVQGSAFAALATPYPSAIIVSNVPGIVLKSTVTLTNLTHSLPSAIQALVVAPNQLDTVIMSGVGLNQSVKTGVTLTFDDAATTSLPRSGQIVTSTNKPTSYTYPSFH